MPIELDVFDKLRAERKQLCHINWESVLEEIITSGKAWNTREVYEKIVLKKCSRYRVITVLNNAVEEGIISRAFDGKRYWYGAIHERTREL